MYYELVYNAQADPNVDEKDILDVQRNYKKFNTTKDITGCLIFYNHQIEGILDGEEEKVRKLFDEINDDPKHTKVKLLACEHTAQRYFQRWDMVFQIDSQGGKIGLTERLFRDNLIILTRLVEKPTYTAQVFWREIRKIIEKNRVQRRYVK